MIQSASENQNKLLTVINEIFTFIIDPYTGKKIIVINPKLTDESLQKIIEKTRKFIIDLYVKCESDYANGVKIYEAIVESKILETTQKQIETLKKEALKIIDETTTSIKTPTSIPNNQTIPMNSSLNTNIKKDPNPSFDFTVKTNNI
jgi:isocitrate dehydrogenase